MNKKRLCIWISAAELSADIHGAKLIESLSYLAPELKYVGMGGPEMRKSNFQAIINAEQLSVMGLTEVLALLPNVFRLYRKIKHNLQIYQPKCIILIDAPDFHFHLAKIAWKMNIPVYYYISPQVWAWRKKRIHFLSKYIKKILCIFPFEKEFFAKHGVDVEFVGHPLLQQIDFQLLDKVPPNKNMIGIMPGSRKREVSSLLPSFASAAEILLSRYPQLKFSLFQAFNINQELILKYWPSHLPYKIIQFSYRYTQIKNCQLIMTASGTASLECALLGVPAIVAYKVSWLSYFMARMIVDVPFISMPNLILKKEVFPEFIQSQVSGANLAQKAIQWVNFPEKINEIQNELISIRKKLGQSEAASKSAQLILESLP